MHYLASNFAHVNGIIVSTAASIFIFVTWVFPSLQKNPHTGIRTLRFQAENKKQGYFRRAVAWRIQMMAHFTLAFRSIGWATISQCLILPRVSCALPLKNLFTTTFQTSSSLPQLHKGEVHIYKEHSLIWLPACSSPYSFLKQKFPELQIAVPQRWKADRVYCFLLIKQLKRHAVTLEQ